MTNLKSQVQKTDRLLFLLVTCLTLFGVLMVYNASVVTAYKEFGDKFFYFRQQIVSIVLGFIALFVLSRIDYHKYTKVAPLLFFGTLMLLVLVLVPHIGIQTMGARRWLGIGGHTIQPAELAKLSLVLYFSSLLSKKRDLLPFLVLLGSVVLLVMGEPDLGTTVVLAVTSIVLYFSSGASILPLSAVGFFGSLIGFLLIVSSNYRKERLLTFFDTSRDPLGASYHIRQVLIALGSGGMFGVGLGASRQKYEYLPESMTDSIFAVIGEEAGFLGAALLVVGFMVVVWKGFNIAREAPDTFGQLLAIGITTWIGTQALVNFSSMVALVPLTGVPLPFISFGGSSIITTMAGVGILLNVSRYRVRKK